MFVRLGWNSLSRTNTCSLQKLVNHRQKSFITLRSGRKGLPGTSTCLASDEGEKFFDSDTIGADLVEMGLQQSHFSGKRRFEKRRNPRLRRH